MIVTATGPHTELGHIARLAAAAQPPPTPLQQRLATLSRAMLLLGLGVMGLLAAGLMLRGASLNDAFLVGVSVAVAAVPEGLAATVTIALAQGARAMADRGAIVRRLSAVETLGSASVIATDKTGTLTLNQMRIVEIEPVRGLCRRDVLEVGVLASTAALVDGEHGVTIAGDHVDGAFLLAAREDGLPDGRRLPGRRALLELPFDPERRRLTVVYEQEDEDERRVAVKGALETLLGTIVGSPARAPPPRGGGRRLGAARAASAGGRGGALPAEAELDGDVDSSLSCLGIVALEDPLRPAAADAVAAARSAGISVAMLTGDHPLTAASIGRQIGLRETPLL